MHHAIINPVNHLDPDDQLPYEEAAVEKGLPPTFKLGMLRRRGYWAATLPPQVWGRDSLTFAEEDDLRRHAELERRKHASSYGFVRGRDCFAKEERWFYRDSVISALRDQFTMPLLAIAVMRFLHAAEDPNNDLVVRKLKPSARVTKAPEDRIIIGDRRHRGPDWTDADDYIVRKWFGRHEQGPHRGKHVPLTEDNWRAVLAALGGKRSKSEVRRRIFALNQELRISLTSNGYVPRLNVDKYLREALGERSPRLPHRREPLKAQRQG